MTNAEYERIGKIIDNMGEPEIFNMGVMGNIVGYCLSKDDYEYILPLLNATIEKTYKLGKTELKTSIHLLDRHAHIKTTSDKELEIVEISSLSDLKTIYDGLLLGGKRIKYADLK